jgi:hypothetical protein
MRAAGFIAASVFALCVSAAPSKAIELEVQNNSKTKIVHLYMSAVDEKKWGEDQLGEDDQDTIDPADSYTIEDIEPGVYDLKLVAEDGTACVLAHVRFAQGKVWTITEELLDTCVKQQ